MRRDDGKQIDWVGLVPVGVPVDVGWGVAVLHADRTCTRTCKGCGASATSAVNDRGRAAPAAITHGPGCPVLERLGNNAALS